MVGNTVYSEVDAFPLAEIKQVFFCQKYAKLVLNSFLYVSEGSSYAVLSHTSLKRAIIALPFAREQNLSKQTACGIPRKSYPLCEILRLKLGIFKRNKMRRNSIYSILSGKR